MRLLVASRNPKKLIELTRVLEAAKVSGVELVGMGDVEPYDEAPEVAPDFEGNALAKAHDGAAATGMACIADDSGLAVVALNGMPGVLSARWSGVHGDDAANVALLLGQLQDVPDERRGAAFVSAAALVVPDVGEHVVVGRWPGRVAREAKGSNGFGYDPIFLPEGRQVSAAEMDSADKDAISHRCRSLAQLVPVLRELIR